MRKIAASAMRPAAVVGSYTFLTLLLTYPSLLQLGVAIPGLTPDGDQWQHVWNLWWVAEALGRLQDPFYTQYIYYPTGADLHFHTLTFLNGLLFLPLTKLLGALTTYTLTAWFSFVLGAYGTFLLARYLGCGALPAFVAGFIFAFSPYHYAHLLGHLNLTSIQWLPLFALYMVKSGRESSPWNPLIGAALLAANILTDFYYGLYAGTLLILFGLYVLVIGGIAPAGRRALAHLGALGMTATVLVGPVILPMAARALDPAQQTGLSFDLDTHLRYSADLLSFFTPSWLHPGWGAYLSDVFDHFASGRVEGVTFLGFTVIALGIVGTVRGGKESRFWWAAAIVFGLLALGPELQLAGNTDIPFLPAPIWLPHKLLEGWPPFSLTQVPARFAVMVVLSLAVLSGLALSHLERRKGGFPYWSLVALALVFAEFLSIPFPMTRAETSPFFTQLRQGGEAGALLDVPISRGSWAMKSMLYQTVHERPIVDGLLSRPYPYPLSDRAPVFRQFSKWREDDDIIRQDLRKVGLSVLNHYGIAYLILRREVLAGLDNQRVERLQQLRDEVLGKGSPAYQDKDIEAYRVPLPVHDEPFMELGEAWYEREQWDGIPTRWMSNDATLRLISPSSGTYRLAFRATPFARVRQLEVYLDGSLAGTQTLDVGSWAQMSVRISVDTGTSTIRLHSREEPQAPSDLGLSPDRRLLSLVFQDFTLTRE